VMNGLQKVVFKPIPKKKGYKTIMSRDGPIHMRKASDKDFADRLSWLAHDKPKDHVGHKKWLEAAFAPLAVGHKYNGSESLVQEKGGKTRVAGCARMNDLVLNAGATASPQGGKLDWTMMTPAAIGDRLGLEAAGYEQSKLIHARVVYAPSVNTTYSGSLTMSYTNETGIDLTAIGTAELAAEASRPSFVSTPFWEKASIDIKPSDANVRYADTLNGEFADDVQGMIVIAVDEPNAANGGDKTTIGSWYIEYDMEFYAQQLSYAIISGNTTQMQFGLVAAIPADLQAGDPVQFYYDASFTSQIPFKFLTNLGVPIPPHTAMLLLLTVTDVTAGTNWAANANWAAQSKPGTSYPFLIGQTFCARLIGNAFNANTVMVLYTDIDSASGPALTGSDDLTTGQLYWPVIVTGNTTGSVTCSVRWAPLAGNLT